MASVGVLPMPSADYVLNFSEAGATDTTIESEKKAEAARGQYASESYAQSFFADVMATALRDSAQGPVDQSSVMVTTHFHGYQPRYDDFIQHQSRIHSVGMRNTISARREITLKNLESRNRSRIVKDLVHSLLSVENLKSFGFDRVNTNEPVILISIPEKSETTGQTVRELRDLTWEYLRDNRGYSGVRVYVRLHPASSGDVADFLELALLNVANSEIGGPSMVQLLDAFFYREDWNKRNPVDKSIIVSKEAWSHGGWELLWRVETDIGTPLEEPTVIKAIPEHEDQLEAADHLPAVEDTTYEATETYTKPSQDGMHPKTIDSDSEDGPVTVEHPAMAELKEKEASRVGIQHPSWNRDESQSLLDLIRRQSSTVKDDLGDVGDKDEKATPSAVVNQDTTKPSKTNSDDSFELL